MITKDAGEDRRRETFVRRTGSLYGVYVVSVVLAVAVPLLFFWLADGVFERELLSFDDSVRALVHGFARPWLTAAFRLVSFLGSQLFLWTLAAVVVSILYSLRHKIYAALIAVTLAGETAMNSVLKILFGRVRPEPFFDYALPASYSFPSGHAFGSFCFYGILAWLAIHQVPGTGAKLIIGIFAFVLISLIGLSRIYLGVHYPSDVAAGFAAGMFWVGLVAIVGTRLEKHAA